MRFKVTQGTERFVYVRYHMVSYYCAAVALSLRDVGLGLETRVLSHSRSSDRQTRTPDCLQRLKFVNSLQVRVIVPNLATPTQAFSLIFIILTAALDVC